MSSTLFVAGALSANPLGATQASAQTSCEEQTLDSVTLYQMSMLPASSNVGEHYQGIIKKIEKTAEEYAWPQFQLTSQDLTINASSYGADQLDVSVSVSFQFQANYESISQAVKSLSAYSLSFSRYPVSGCDS